MMRPKIGTVTVVIVAVVVLLGVFLPVFNSVRITTSSMTMFLSISRNGKEVPADQIRSIKYVFAGHPPEQLQDVTASSWREANDNEGLRSFWAPIRIVRTGIFPFVFETVEPEIHSVVVRVVFTDDKTVSLACPMITDKRESGRMLIDLSDGSK